MFVGSLQETICPMCGEGYFAAREMHTCYSKQQWREDFLKNLSAHLVESKKKLRESNLITGLSDDLERL